MLKPKRTREVNKGRLLPICESGNWTFSAISRESRLLGKPLDTAVLSRINRGTLALSEKNAEILATILGVDANALRKVVNGKEAA